MGSAPATILTSPFWQAKRMPGTVAAIAFYKGRLAAETIGK